MEKRISAVALAAGIALGAAGTHWAESDHSNYVAHAWDVRRHERTLKDGGVETSYSVEAWFSRRLPDGGFQDVGPGKRCELNATQLEAEHDTLVETCAPGR